LHAGDDGLVIERRTLELCGLDHPAYEARGASDGPHVALIAGVHGCEYSSIAAVTRFMNELDTSELSGSITAVPVVSMQSFRLRSPFVVPEDGKNLNRSFPGSHDGTYTERLARSIFEQVIEPADVLLDLHGGDLVEALEPFTIYDASPHEERTREIALAFGLPYVIRQELDESGLGGMTSSAAARAGIPAVIAEAGGCGQLEDAATSLLVDGVRNVLRHLGMLPGEPAPPRSRSVEKFVWLRAAREGWWQPVVAAGEEVAESQPVGTLRDLYGDVLEELRAPQDGVVLFLTTSPAVSVDGPLLGLGADLS
jgi:predicted deacylase